jgi:desulfoferrodoxin (superoxide reductase-like protein)
MVEEHHITDIWVLDQRGNQIACDILHANDTATLSFNIEDHVTEIVAIEHCNLHGVWMADPVTL